MKKGQITTFIILGFVVLLVVVLILVIQSLDQQEYTESTATFSSVQFALFPPDQYVQLCTEEQLLEMMVTISQNGGIYDPSDPNITEYRYAQYYPYRSESFLFHYSENSGQLIITPRMISEQIDEYLGSKVKSCINETLYEDQGYEVNSGDINTQTTIAQDDIVVLVSYPLELIRNDVSVKKESFQVRVNYPYGYLLDTVRNIINHEIEENEFSQERFMNQLGNIEFDSYIVDIQKYKPYPHILYNLSVLKDGVRIPFYFAIEGRESFGANSLDLLPQQSAGDDGGCCQVNGACFKDTTKELCSFAQGVFDESSDCSCVTDNTNDEEISSNSLNACDGKPSGYSYCGDFSGVGGRDFRVICQDGEWVQEFCRDYKQEVCVQEDVGDMSYTQCRLNNALSCTECTTQECCEQKDCQFLPGGSCVPKKPLGLRFWDKQSSNSYCEKQFAQLPGVTSVVDAQVLCSQVGDCSLKSNFIGEYPYEPSELYLERQELLQEYDDLSYESSIIFEDDDSYSSSHSFSTILANSLEQLDILINSPLEDFYDPQDDSSQESQFICQSYSPPTFDQCAMCDSMGECSEYSCRSLGDNCFYLIDSTGSGVCKTINVTSGSLELSNIRVSDKSVEQTYINDSRGFAVTQNISAGEPVDVSFKTSQPALCKPTYLPDQTFSQISSPDLSAGIYTTNHTLQLRFINDLPVFETLLDRFEVPTFSSLASALIEFKYRLDQLQSRYPYVQKFQLPLYSQVSNFVEVYLDEDTQPLMNGLINLLSEKTYGLFFSCISQTGATNQDTFVLLSLKNSCENHVAIESITGDNGNYTEEEFFVRTDTWAQCKYDYVDKPFSQMNFSLTCPTSMFDVQQDGSYECNGLVPPLADSVAIKCSQHPYLFAQDYSFNFTFDINNSAPLNIELDITNMTTNLSMRNTTYITLETPTPYLCSINNSHLPCTLDSCQLTQEYLNLSKPHTIVDCTPRDSQRYCSTDSPLIQPDSTIFSIEEPELFTLDYNVSQTTIEIIPSSLVTCTVYSSGSVLSLEKEEYEFLKEPYTGNSVRIVCEDDFEQTQEVVINYVD